MFVYRREDATTWTLLTKLYSPDNAVAGDMLGSSLSLKDGIVVAGAPFDGTKLLIASLLTEFRFRSYLFECWISYCMATKCSW